MQLARSIKTATLFSCLFPSHPPFSFVAITERAHSSLFLGVPKTSRHESFRTKQAQLWNSNLAEELSHFTTSFDRATVVRTMQILVLRDSFATPVSVCCGCVCNMSSLWSICFLTLGACVAFRLFSTNHKPRLTFSSPNSENTQKGISWQLRSSQEDFAPQLP